MNSFVVHKILQVGTKQLLLIQPSAYECTLAIYDEHTGQTLMRLTNASLEEFKRAIALLESN